MGYVTFTVNLKEGEKTAMARHDKIYKDIDKIPTGKAGESKIPGFLVLEGGGWKGLYTLGVLDAMMEEDINIDHVIGVSAGALSALGYLSGEIGWGARIDLRYRHDKNYVGLGALKKDHGITGFTYLYKNILKKMPLDEKRLMDPDRKLFISTTKLVTGETIYFEKGKCDLYRAVQASATVPYVSAPVEIDGELYLDGGCGEKIPYEFALNYGEKKIVVVKTRELSYRRKPGTSKLAYKVYCKYPAFIESLEKANEIFNETTERLIRDAADGKIFLMAPSEPVKVKRFDGDMEKLGELYWLGYKDMKARIPELKAYLK